MARALNWKSELGDLADQRQFRREVNHASRLDGSAVVGAWRPYLKAPIELFSVSPPELTCVPKGTPDSIGFFILLVGASKWVSLNSSTLEPQRSSSGISPRRIATSFEADVRTICANTEQTICCWRGRNVP